nr:polysaccharide biosynthesis/export family protein [uncultured Desulfobacter sp.]
MSRHYVSCFMSLLIVLSFILTISPAFSKEKKIVEEEKECTQEPAEDYKIGVGDVLQISTWKEEDLTFDKVFVRNDGKITFPLLDDIQAAGRTTVELKQDIQEKLAEFVEAPTVTVTLANPGSQKYYILGEVQKVGEYHLIKKLTVVQAFALAEGFTEWASKDEIILFRRHQGKELMIKIDYDDITDGNLKNDIQLKADDIIIVP